MTAEAFAPAKINLSLHVTGRRADGYHFLDSLVVFADVGDRLTLRAADTMDLSVTGPFAAGVPCDARNLVWRAAAAAGVTVAMTLDKQLPHGGGIGGGSADAAAVLRMLGAPHHAPDLGADVPVCLSRNPQRMQGIGDVLSPATGVPALDIVLVNPGVHVPTQTVFARLRSPDNPGMGAWPTWQDRAAFVAWLCAQRNDLQAPAAADHPEIDTALAALSAAQLARMSGSGSTCFGIYPTAAAAQKAADRIAAAHPDWWVQATQTTGAS